MNTKFFETKEQYLAFRAAWRAAVNDVRAKPHFTEEAARVSGRETSIVLAKVRHDGWLRAEHHILFNIIRGKEPNHGFTPITNQNKLDNGATPWLAYNQALGLLRWTQSNAERAMTTYERYVGETAGWPLKDKTEDEKRVKYNKFVEFNMTRVNKFIEPFGGTITVEDLVKIKLPEAIHE